jgi:membrane protease YdiL (CAAX protease family)
MVAPDLGDVEQTTEQNPRGRLPFREAVRVEELPEHLEWHWIDWVATVTIPLVFATATLTNGLGVSLWTRGFIDLGLRAALCLVLVWAYRRMLARHWQAFNRARWRSLALVVGGAVVMQMIVTGVRSVLPASVIAWGPQAPDDGLSAAIDVGSLSVGGLFLFTFIALGPLFTAVIEDTVFRHTFLMKIPVWRHAILAVALIIVNGLAFGAVHYYNFGSFGATLPFAAAGVFFNLVYLWTRNIWHVLGIHLFNNFVLGVAIMPVLIVAKLFGVY